MLPADAPAPPKLPAARFCDAEGPKPAGPEGPNGAWRPALAPLDDLALGGR